MFTFIIATNRVTSELSKIIDTLLKTKRDADVVMIINYNNYSIDYRAFPLQARFPPISILQNFTVCCLYHNTQFLLLSGIA